MKRYKVNIVWLKRDLRTQDHEPLFFAEKAKTPYIIIYIFDTQLLKHPDVGVRHLQFAYHSIKDLNTTLEPYNRTVNIFYGRSKEVFKYLFQQYNIQCVFSYQETGIQKSWDRDKGVSNFLNDNGVPWQEFQQNGVIRGLKNRDNWAKRWKPVYRWQLWNSYHIKFYSTKTIYC